MANADSRVAVLSYKPGTEDGFLELLRLALGVSFSSPKTKQFWTWKHLRNPFGVSEGLYAVDPQTQRIVGLRIFMKWRLQAADGTPVYAARAVDTAVHPEYRRLGIFSMLTQRGLTGLMAGSTQVIFNTPNPRSLAGYLKLGWREGQPRPLYLRMQNPACFAGPLYRPNRPREGIPPWETCFKPGVQRWKSFFDQFNDEIRSVSEAWEMDRRRTGYRTPRSLEYLNWRYGGNPDLSYGVFHLADGNGLRGFLIMRPAYRNGFLRVGINEIILREPRLSLGLRLIRQACRHVSADWIFAHAAPRTLERTLLLLSRFHRWPGAKIRFAIRPLTISLPEHGLARDWDLSLGDLEIF